MPVWQLARSNPCLGPLIPRKRTSALPLRWSIALVWIVTGIVSLGLYPVQESYALLARTGITGALAATTEACPSSWLRGR